MKILKYSGKAILIITAFLALGIVGRMETEDRQYQRGEITQEEMTTDDTLFKMFIGSGAVALTGGAMWVVGSYIEADRIERKYRRYNREI